MANKFSVITYIIRSCLVIDLVFIFSIIVKKTVNKKEAGENNARC